MNGETLAVRRSDDAIVGVEVDAEAFAQGWEKPKLGIG
jgi:hypothetical protein